MLWDRLKRLERCCDVRIESYLAPGTGALRWRATIRLRAGDALTVVADHADITDAVQEAVDRSEALGWLTEGSWR